MRPARNSLPLQLLEQAEHLFRRDRTRPNQANARRSVSASYYAVFHFLGAEAGRVFVGAGRRQRPLRIALGRALDHGSLRAVCTRLSARGSPTNFPAPLRDCLRDPISADLRGFAQAVLYLQDARHRADYDLSTQVKRAQALQGVVEAREAMRTWTRIPDEETHAFLLATWAWRNLAAR